MITTCLDHFVHREYATMPRSRSNSPSRPRSSRSPSGRTVRGGAGPKKVRKTKTPTPEVSLPEAPAVSTVHPLDQIDWSALRKKYPNHEIEVRPHLERERISGDTVTTLVKDFAQRTDYVRTESWMLRVQAKPSTLASDTPRWTHPKPRLTIMLPMHLVKSTVDTWTDLRALQSWVTANKKSVVMDIKKTIVREEDPEWPVRMSIAEETVESVESFPWHLVDRVRFLRRLSYRHVSNTFQIDLSFVRDAVGKTAFPISGLLSNPANLHGETEIELLPTPPQEPLHREILSLDLRRILERVLYPGIVPSSTSKEVLIEYLSRLAPQLVPTELRNTPPASFAHAIATKTNGKLSQWFVGYNVTGFKLEHILQTNGDEPLHEPRFLDPRSRMLVTEKADGERHLLLTMSDGRAFFINNRLQVSTAPVQATEGALGCLLDGEYLEDRKLFLVFDCLIDRGEDVRAESFWFKDREGTALRGRYARVRKIVDAMRSADDAPQGSRIRFKVFYPMLSSLTPQELLTQAHAMWTQRSKRYEYMIDGLIFVSADRPYLSITPGATAQTTDPWVLKWKPSHMMTIDFLVMNPQPVSVLAATMPDKQVRYTQVELYVGSRFRNEYIAAPFVPTPRTIFAGMKTVGLTPEPIATPCVVECEYVPGAPEGHRWRPLRVRHDKTQLFKMAQADMHRFHNNTLRFSGVGANNERVAADVWRAIQSKILGREDLFEVVTQPDIQTEIQQRIEELNVAVSDDTSRYYKNQERTKEDRAKSIIIGLRNFHNSVKHTLIVKTVNYIRELEKENQARPVLRVLDLGAGRGGDLRKYLDADIQLLAALEVSAPELDELQQRYQQLEQSVKAQGGSIFRLERFHGDMRYKLTKGEAGKAVNNAQSATELENFFQRNDHKIQLVTSMFAMHYAFDTEKSRATLMYNIYRATTLGGCFIGVAFDGARVLEALKKNKGELVFTKQNQVFARIRSAFSEKDSASLRPYGQAIDFQFDTITAGDDDVRREYLIDFQALDKDLKEIYNIQRMTNEEAAGLLGLDTDAPTGHLSDFVPRFHDLSEGEKAFSSMYRYFIYQKILPGNLVKMMELEKRIS